MNQIYDTKLKVSDMERDNIQMVMDQSCIDKFNSEFDEDFSYYFVEWEKDNPIKLYGCDSIFKHNNVYFVSDL